MLLHFRSAVRKSKINHQSLSFSRGDTWRSKPISKALLALALSCHRSLTHTKKKRLAPHPKAKRRSYAQHLSTHRPGLGRRQRWPGCLVQGQGAQVGPRDLLDEGDRQARDRKEVSRVESSQKQKERIKWDRHGTQSILGDGMVDGTEEDGPGHCVAVERFFSGAGRAR